MIWIGRLSVDVDDGDRDEEDETEEVSEPPVLVAYCSPVVLANVTPVAMVTESLMTTGACRAEGPP